MNNLPTNKKYLVAGSIALFAFLVYVPALRNGFINWDDNDYVYENLPVRTFNLQLFRWAFFDFHAANWHPLTWLSHAIDYAIWGLDPFGHHLTNNIIHAINTFVVVLLVVKLVEVFEESTGRQGTPDPFWNERTKLMTGATTGLLFGIHPLHVESVAWVSERKDLLCALFFLLSILSYMKYRAAGNGPGRRKPAYGFFDKQYLLAFGFFVLALLSKPMAVTLPAVLLILDWHPAGRVPSARAFKVVFTEKIPFFLLSLLSSVITVLAQRSGHAIVPLEHTTLAVRAVVGAKALIVYFFKVLVPVDLLPFYPYPRDVSLLSLQYIFFVALVAGVTVACLAVAKVQKLWLAVWMYYVVTLLPVLGIIQVGGQSMADRYTYLPTLGYLLIAGIGLTFFFRKAFDPRRGGVVMRSFFIVACCLIVLFLSYASVSQIRLWKNSISLWSYLIETGRQEVPLAFYNRGLAYGEKNQLGPAIDDFSSAISISPGFDMAYNNRGVAYFLQNRDDKAFEDFNKATELNKNNSEAYINRAYLYLKTGKNALALPDLQKGCALGNEVGCKVLRNLLKN